MGERDLGSERNPRNLRYWDIRIGTIQRYVKE